jgi:hypothetical protein
LAGGVWFCLRLLADPAAFLGAACLCPPLAPARRQSQRCKQTSSQIVAPSDPPPQLRLRLYRSTSPGVPAPHSRFRYLYITGPPTPVQQVERDFSSLRVADTANILLASTPSKNKKKKGTIFFDDVRPVFCRSSSPTPSPHLVHAPGIFILAQRLPLEFYVASFQSRSG